MPSPERSNPQVDADRPESEIETSLERSAGDSVQHINNTAEEPLHHHRRAVQACSRCRKQKLRCLGGMPCMRCVKANMKCDFSKGSGGVIKGIGDENPGVVKARLEHLESRVANLLAGLKPEESGSSSLPPAPAPLVTQAPAPPSPGTGTTWPFNYDSSAFMNDPVQLPSQLPGSPTPIGQRQVTFDNSPGVTFVSSYSPFNLSDATNSTRTHDEGKEGRKKKDMGPEERLASLTTNGFEAPFKALVYRPSVWENREASRRSSPLPSERSSDPIARRLTVRDDPVSCGIIDEHTARVLFTFYMTNCHPFLPIIDIDLPDPFSHTHRSGILSSAILAISARFYLRHSTPASILLETHIPATLADMAESHLGQTLLRKEHTLADVQAILLLAAWGLQSGGRGPDAWVLTGYAARVARRLGIHRVVKQAITSTINGEKPFIQDDEMEALLRRQWRFWLACFSFDAFLSLGFGRPQGFQIESVDEQAFLKARLSNSLPRPGTAACQSLYGDAYIAATAGLSHIARSLVSWTEDRSPSSPPEGLSLLAMLTDLNGRLDEWCKFWVWSGSTHALYLGASARIARLQSEHLRLSINSMVLRPSSQGDVPHSNVPYLRKALNAATSTIQTQFESNQTDLALSFATDYMTITLSQAAVFLIRLTKASPSVQQVISLDGSVVSHYVSMSVDVLEFGDKSETRLSTYLARTIRAISRVAGLVVRPDDSSDPSGNEGLAHPEQPQASKQNALQHSSSNVDMLDAVDTLWTGEDHFDLRCFLGVSGGAAQEWDWLEPAIGNAGIFDQSAWDASFDAGQGLVSRAQTDFALPAAWTGQR